jgi:hypothetical protein
LQIDPKGARRLMSAIDPRLQAGLPVAQAAIAIVDVAMDRDGGGFLAAARFAESLDTQVGMAVLNLLPPELVRQMDSARRDAPPVGEVGPDGVPESVRRPADFALDTAEEPAAGTTGDGREQAGGTAGDGRRPRRPMTPAEKAAERDRHARGAATGGLLTPSMENSPGGQFLEENLVAPLREGRAARNAAGATPAERGGLLTPGFEGSGSQAIDEKILQPIIKAAQWVALPAGFRSFYVYANGKWHMTQEGLDMIESRRQRRRSRAEQ